MTRTFTADDNGEKFEMAYIIDTDGWQAIKPIKAVEKKWYDIIITSWDDQADLFGKSLELTRPTAQKVAEAVEALMEYILRPYPINPEYEEDDVKFVEADEARAAFREENNG